MRFVVLLKERPMLEDVGVRSPALVDSLGSSEPLNPTSSTSRPYFSLATFFATSATSCSAPLITPTFNVLRFITLLVAADQRQTRQHYRGGGP